MICGLYLCIGNVYYWNKTRQCLYCFCVKFNVENIPINFLLNNFIKQRDVITIPFPCRFIISYGSSKNYVRDKRLRKRFFFRSSIYNGWCHSPMSCEKLPHPLKKFSFSTHVPLNFDTGLHTKIKMWNFYYKSFIGFS